MLMSFRTSVPTLLLLSCLRLVFGNIGTVISFRVGTNDAEFLAKYFSPAFDSSDLQRVPNHNAIVRMLIGGVPSQAFSMAGLPPLGTENKQLFDALKQLSAAKYGRPRAQVESEIFERLKTNEVPAKPAFGSGLAGQAGGALPSAQSPYGNAPAAGPAAQAAARPASLLDDWLSRRNDQPARPVVAPQPFGPAPVQPMATAPVAPAPQPVSAPQPFAASNVQATAQPTAPQSNPPQGALSYPSISSAVGATTNSSMAQQLLDPTPDLTTVAPVDSQKEVSKTVQESAAKNITSNELEEQEVANIARELRQGLDDSKLANGNSGSGHLEAGDTIFIDQDGNMTSGEVKQD
jgi:hypothetical protein